MRERFAGELACLTGDLAIMCDAVGRSVGSATTALLEADPVVLATVIEDCRDIDERHRDVERRVVVVLARQAPVGRELRSIVASLHIAGDVGRMAGLTRHICEIGLRRRREESGVTMPRDAIATMGAQAAELAASAASALRVADADAARRLEAADEAMDALCRALLADIDTAASGDVATGIDLALLCRFYERVADHAVSIGRRVHFLSTGRTAV